MRRAYSARYRLASDIVFGRGFEVDDVSSISRYNFAHARPVRYSLRPFLRPSLSFFSIVRPWGSSCVLISEINNKRRMVKEISLWEAGYQYWRLGCGQVCPAKA